MLELFLGRISMRETKLCALVVATLAIATLAATPAEAQATRTWVSGSGDDTNPCSQITPCKTFAGAMSKTAADGEINCIEPGGFGAVTITKAITIDCGGTFGTVLNAGANGIIIDAKSSDVVRIRNLSVEGAGSGLNGINILAAASVHIENVIINGQSQAGIRDVRAGPGRLFVTHAVIRNSGGTGVAVAPASAVVTVVLENVLSVSNNIGAAVGKGGNLRVNRSVLSGNGNVGLQVAAGGTAVLDSSVISHNAVGVQADAGSAATIEGSVISHNVVGIQKDGGSPNATPDRGGVGGRSL
jgi:hypothetical protein